MKLVNCPACDRECSAQATTCPNCGHPFIENQKAPNAGKWNAWKVLTLALGALILASALGSVGYVFFGDSIIQLASVKLGISNTSNKETLAIGNTPPTPAPQPKAVLEIETGIDYHVGGVQPITSTTFSLLDKDAEQIIRASGLKSNRVDLLSEFGFGLQFYSDTPEMKKALAGIRTHTKYTMKTDLQGKAIVENIRPDVYYVFGVAETRKGFVIWNVRTTINPGRNKLTLDVSNAAIAF